MTKAWLFLIAAIVVEMFATTSLKLSDGFQKLPWVIAMIAAYGFTFYALSVVVRTLPLGLAYAIWAGIGTVGASFIGSLVFKEQNLPMRWLGVFLVVAGVVVLNLSQRGDPQ